LSSVLVVRTSLPPFFRLAELVSPLCATQRIDWLNGLTSEEIIVTAESADTQKRKHKNGQDKSETAYATSGSGQQYRLHVRPHPHVLFPP
jgi:hypothetical protein